MPASISAGSTSRTARTRRTAKPFAGFAPRRRRPAGSIAILQDLSGPKIRTGRLKGGKPIELKEGQTISDRRGRRRRRRPAHPYDVCRAGGKGAARRKAPARRRPNSARVVETRARDLRRRSSRAVRLASTRASTPRAWLLAPAPHAEGHRRPAVRRRARRRHGRAQLRAQRRRSAAGPEDSDRGRRAEMPLDRQARAARGARSPRRILRASQGVMVARGDLGLEIPLERVPTTQKEITRARASAAVPVIVATQVLESMRTEPRPTRAEVSDAANAVDDGVDAIMLAGETAIGRYPVKTVETLDAIIREAERIGSERISADARRWARSSICPAPRTHRRSARRRSRSRIIAAPTRSWRSQGSATPPGFCRRSARTPDVRRNGNSDHRPASHDV